MPLLLFFALSLLSLTAGKYHAAKECICPTLATEVTPTPDNSPTECPGDTKDDPADSCKAIIDCNPSAPSGYYWISNGVNSYLMYCYMEADKCGMKGVMRVAHIDMKNPSVNCPPPLTEHKPDSGRRLCASTNTTRTTCDSVIFPTHRFRYHHVCGRAVGFSFHHPCGFWYGHTTINDAYVSGLSITYGPQNKRKHIWTYAGGFQERFFHFCNCPCATFPGARPPPFVCQDFYCETATFYPPPEYDRQWYTNNTLWDGEDCNPGSHCCNNALAPWFRRTLKETTTEDIEVRWCVIQQVLRDRVGTELLELYIY